MGRPRRNIWTGEGRYKYTSPSRHPGDHLAILGTRHILTFSRDIVLVFSESVLGEAGDEGHCCSIRDLQQSLVISASVPAALPLPPPAALPTHLVMLQSVQAPP